MKQTQNQDSFGMAKLQTLNHHKGDCPWICLSLPQVTSKTTWLCFWKLMETHY